VRLAAENGLSGIALTDHDTTDGVAEARAAAASVGIDFLPGIEVSCAHPRPGTLHMLAYGFDPEHPAMRTLTRVLREARQVRAERIAERLGHAGVALTVADVVAGAGGTGRPHFAKLLIDRGHARSTRDAFDRFLGGSGVAYVENNPLFAEQVIPLVRAAGGLCALAHPFQLRRATFAQLEAMVCELADQGMQGLETLHGSHTTEQVHQLTRLADRLDLIPTGGSDFHGTAKPWIRLGEGAGRRPIPRALYDGVRGRLASRTAVAAPAA
jgi:predicted metal-dependent phosphoesterase TrpH